MPDATLQSQPTAETALYPAGHLESLPLDALIAERECQRAAARTDAEAAARARLCTQEMIRRRLAALFPTEQAQ